MLATVSKSLLFTIIGTDTMGHVDRMPVLNMKIREVHVMHCDGMNTSLREVVLSSAIGDGPRLNTINLAGLGPVRRYLGALLPPRYPFAIDASKVKGKSNGGHTYDTDLPDDQKDALVEDMKTLETTTGGRAASSPPREGLA